MVMLLRCKLCAHSANNTKPHAQGATALHPPQRVAGGVQDAFGGGGGGGAEGHKPLLGALRHRHGGRHIIASKGPLAAPHPSAVAAAGHIVVAELA